MLKPKILFSVCLFIEMDLVCYASAVADGDCLAVLLSASQFFPLFGGGPKTGSYVTKREREEARGLSGSQGCLTG